MSNILISEVESWITHIVRFMPGKIGFMARYFKTRSLFKKSQKCSFGLGCQFISPENIELNGFIQFGENSFFTATGGSIKISGNTSFNMNVHINADIGGKIEIGESCLIGPNVVMRTADHRFEKSDVIIRNQGHNINDIIIEDDVWIAANVVIVGGVNIGHGTIVGAGSVVTKNIPPMVIAGGVPAKIIKHRIQ